MTPENFYDEPAAYRDHLATVDPQGKRIWIYPKKPSGRFYNRRTLVSWVLLGLLFGMPFIKVNGEPLLLFNFPEGKFIIFSIVFTTYDLHLFALAMVTLMVSVVLFTVVFGRLFCGWVCPQTIFMEMVFRKIEYWIEGDAQQQVKRNRAPWTTDKLVRKSAKHLLFFLIAVVIANLFLSYIIGADAVFAIMTEPVSDHLAGFAAMWVFSGLFYGVFAFLREQVCTTICPYGRMQGVLLVPESIVIIYDYLRGEPRGKRKKNGPQEMSHPLPVVAADPDVRGRGDCIDCNRCVNVCPTGIDIRNGTQLECVNCTACIDACDFVMDKIGKPRGLIRYDSAERIRSGSRRLFHPRAIAYAAVLLLLLVLQAFLFTQRGPVESLVLKIPGQLYQQLDNGQYRNIYHWEIINKSGKDIRHIRFRVTEPEGALVTLVGTENGDVSLERAGMAKGVMLIDLPAEALGQTKVTLRMEVLSDDQPIDRMTTNFLGPIQADPH